MTAGEALDLFTRLRAAFPRIVEQETIDLYLERLAGWELEPGRAAVESLIDNAGGWPTLAECRSAYWRERDRLASLRDHEHLHAGRAWRGDETDPAGSWEDFEPVPPPPDFLALASRIGRDMPDDVDVTALPAAGAGDCADCRRAGWLRDYRGRLLCDLCAGSRMAAASRLVASAVPPAGERSLDTSVPSAGGIPIQADEMSVSGRGRGPEPPKGQGPGSEGPPESSRRPVSSRASPRSCGGRRRDPSS